MNPIDMYQLAEEMKSGEKVEFRIENVLADKEVAKELQELNGREGLHALWPEIVIKSENPDEKRRTLLHILSHHGDVPLLKLALYFINEKLINHQDADGATALHVAAFNQNQEAVRILLDPSTLKKPYGVNPNLLDKSGTSPLHFAAIHGNVEIAKLLREYGAEIDVRDEKGLSAADYAVYRLHSFDMKSGKAVKDDPIQVAKYKTLIKELAPKEGALSIEEVIEKLQMVRVEKAS